MTDKRCGSYDLTIKVNVAALQSLDPNEDSDGPTFRHDVEDRIRFAVTRALELSGLSHGSVSVAFEVALEKAAAA
jgi:hypothetical protein